MEAKRDSLFVQVFSIALVSIMLVGSVPIMSLAAEQEAGTSVIVEAGSSAEYSFPVTAIEQPASLVGGEIAAQSPVLPVPSAVMQDMYADSAVDQVAVPVPAVIGSPDDVKYPLATNLYYARASGSAWGLGSGAILSVEIAAEWSSSGLADDGAIVKYYDSSLSAYGATLTAVDSANYATDHTLYLDVTGDKAVWTWADVANIHPEITFAKIGGPDGGSVYVDALWVRIQYDAVQLEYNLPVSLGWNLLSFPQVVSNSNILSVLDDCGGDTVWESVKGYDGLLATPWQGYNTLIPPELCKLNNVNNMMGLWVKITNTGTDGTLKVSGTPPTTTAINLYSGWNLVGYPTLEPKLASVSLSGTGADMISVFKSTTPYIEDRMDLSTVTMQPGNGYWIHVPSDSVWNVGDVTPPTFGGLVSATDSITDGAVYLSWNPATDPSYPITYNIYMATTAGGQNFASPNYVTDQTSIEVGGLITGQPYYFIVRAQDSAGNEDANVVERSATPVIPDTTHPQIIATVPANLATGIAVGQSIIVTFSESINTASFAYSCAPNPGGWSTAWSTVTYTNDRVTLTHSNLAYSTVYTFTVTAAIDLAGNPLAAGPVPNPWTFTTTSAPDTISPYIAVTTPVSAATGVAVTQSVIITFSESINTASFAYSSTPNPGGWSAAWSTVTYTNDRVTLTHTNFAYNTVYTITVTAANDLAGNPLAAGPVPNPWSFTTTTAPDTIGPTITATTPVSGATNVAIAQSVVITFSESINTASFAYSCAPNPGGWNAVWSTVTYTNDRVTLTHTNFAYGTSHTFTVTAANDLAGNALTAGAVPNPWSFTTLAAPDTIGPIVSGVSAAPNPIVQGNTLTLTASVSDATTGNSNAAAAEWSRGASAAAAGSGTAMSASDGNFNSPTEGVTASLSTAGWPIGTNTLWVRGRDAANNWGNAVSTAVTVNGADTVPPQVESNTPANGATGVLVSANIVVDFNEAMNQGNTQGAFSTVPSVAGAFSWNAGGDIMTFNPTANLAYSTLYTVTILVAATDLAGNTLDGDKDGVMEADNKDKWVFSFTTGAEPDTTGPYIITTTPANAATGVAITQSVIITFSESINTGTFAYSCTPNPGGWSATWSTATYTNDRVTLTHTNFVYSTGYTFTVSAAQDTSGNTLTSGPVPNPWSFTTQANPDATGPIVSSVTATPNPVSLGSMLTLTASVSDVTTGNNNVAQAEWSRGASAAAAGSGTAMGASDGTFNTPTEGVTASISTTGWPSGTNTLWVRGRDSVGNWGNAVSASVTVTVPDTIPPQVTTNTPANGATGIVITTNVVVDFNEPMNQGNTQGAFSTNPSVAGAFSWNAGGDIMTFNPTANLAYSTLYTVTILVAATDLAGNTLDGDKDGTMEGDNKDKWVFSFTTAAAPDTIRPYITTTTPASGATGVAVTQSVIITFSESINTGTFAYSSNPNPGGWSAAWSTVTFTNDRVTLTHTSFAAGTTYTLTVSAASDLAGNTLTSGPVPNPWSFATTAGSIHRYAVCVGINKYDYQNDLTYCVNDASECRANLLGAGYSVNLLTDGQATKVAMLAALNTMGTNEVAGDYTAFTYSGHGGTSGGKYFICPEDCYYITDMITDDEMDAIFDTYQSTHQLLFFDSCNSGGLSLGQSGRLHIMAAAANQYSWDGQSDIANGVWTYYFWEYGYRLGNAGSTVLETVFAYAKPLASAYVTTNYGYSMTPQISDGYTGSFYL